MNVYPQDLEAAVRAQPQIRDCAVVPIDRGGNAEACAVLVLQPHANGSHASQTAARAITEANARLGAHQQIRNWVIWPDSDFPRTSTQKPRQDLIASYARGQITQSGNGNVPHSSVEAAIASLHPGSRNNAVKLDDDLNLSSIDRVDLLTALEQRHQVELDESEFAEATTVADIERILHEANVAPRESRHHFPHWAQHALVRWIRIVIYYVFTWPATLLMAQPT